MHISEINIEGSDDSCKEVHVKMFYSKRFRRYREARNCWRFCSSSSLSAACDLVNVYSWLDTYLVDPLLPRRYRFLLCRRSTCLFSRRYLSTNLAPWGSFSTVMFSFDTIEQCDSKFIQVPKQFRIMNNMLCSVHKFAYWARFLPCLPTCLQPSLYISLYYIFMFHGVSSDIWLSTWLETWERPHGFLIIYLIRCM